MNVHVLGSIDSATIMTDGLEIRYQYGKVRVSILGPRIIRVQVTRTENYRDQESFARVPYNEDVQWDAFEDADSWTINSELFRLEIGKPTFSFVVYDQEENVLLESDKELALEWTPDGFRYRLKMHEDTHFYGLGEKTGGLDKRGRMYVMWNTDSPYPSIDADPLYQSIPFLITMTNNIACGLFIDNTCLSFFDLGHSSNEYFLFGADAGPLDLYLIVGPEISDILQAYTALTGRPLFIPRWALGHQFSRWTEYRSEMDIIRLATEFRNRMIPCDTLVLDIEYMDEYRIFTWNRRVFPDPHRLSRQLSEMGIRLMTIIDPGVKKEPGYFMYDEGMAHNFFLRNNDGSVYVGLVWPGETVFPDFTRAEVRNWFGSKYSLLSDCGVSNSSWIDMNEPSNCIYEGLRNEYSMKSVVDHEGHPWESQLRNVYGLGMAQAVFEGLKRVYPHQRPFVLTRSGFAGYQRYAATWTGDIHATWEHLRLSIPMLLNLGLSGIPICGADVGGFADDIESELFIRWYQLGSFYPFFRNHSNISSSLREPWLFGDEVLQLVRECVSLRYTLLRYLYSLAWLASQTGIPIMRPLVLEFQNDSLTHTVDDEFMIGSSLLIAPVLDKNASSRRVYLPACTWFDFNNNRCINGPAVIEVDTNLSTIPIYVRGGSCIPVGKLVQNTDEDQGDLHLLVYPGGESTLLLYEDDGISADGPSALRTIRVESDNNMLSVIIGVRTGEWHPPIRQILVEIRTLDHSPRQVLLDGIDCTRDLLSLQGRGIGVMMSDDGCEHHLVVHL